ncbi:hypothetical protein [Intestinibacillus massiliensis]|uniref:hypothetical protein n=1 Tax=Intestinibacillus massiliensis TaxID=1871029 RepID=UPI001A9A40CC|nr:hypothetical protein [Intestinibacillus massiliensis]
MLPEKTKTDSDKVVIDLKRLETGLKELNPQNLAYIAGYVDGLNEKEPPDKPQDEKEGA